MSSRKRTKVTSVDFSNTLLQCIQTYMMSLNPHSAEIFSGCLLGRIEHALGAHDCPFRVSMKRIKDDADV